jgi:protein-tyrosine-phosphatase
VEARRLRLRIPGHRMIADCMRMLAGPVVLAEPAGPANEATVTAADLIGRAGPAVELVIDDGRARYAQPPSTVALDGSTFRLVREGVVAADTLRRLSSLMVVFVCTGNTCRSPMAEALFRVLAAERLGCRPDEIEQHGVMVASAGLAAWGGGPASGHAVETMAEMGGSLAAHESQPLTEDLVAQADLILTMTNAHRAAIVGQFPEAGGRVTLSLGGPLLFERAAVTAASLAGPAGAGPLFQVGGPPGSAAARPERPDSQPGQRLIGATPLFRRIITPVCGQPGHSPSPDSPCLRWLSAPAR